MSCADDSLPIVELLEERRHLLDLAHWVLGSSSEAESVVDETYRRWYELSGPARARIESPRSWLAKVVGGICGARLNTPDCGRGPAEVEGAGETPAGQHETPRSEVGQVLRDALHALSPAERAAFMVNEVFGVTPDAVADNVGQPEPADPVERALRGLGARRSRPTTPHQHDQVAQTFRQACLTRDTALLASLLAPDATAFFDGGGKVRALVKPVHGNHRVARCLSTLFPPRTDLRLRSVNGRTGLVMHSDHQVAAVISLDVADHHVRQIWVTLNPDKLCTWNEAGGPSFP
ncbi:RNA polymerase subunit sigma [Streptomyces chromofuscus]|uniref:RNA polymerase subunit sigma n=1 Tax=Streptomyces chromofuscus TaxID=42881 RepID=A0A7M2TBR0_STRCW|nr:RNA polymerase subunit sigma [Streptomyces chromofuscus]QOV45148.1 RNA polymerase subunit sigma [Streptomyces chromofuscus]GGT33323.1 RNA polymerase sigma factor [Streptomyces chromofuscus]